MRKVFCGDGAWFAVPYHPFLLVGLDSLSVLKRSVPTTLAFAFGSRLRSKKRPVLAFLGKARKTTQKARSFLPAEPLKSLGRKGKTLQKARKFLAMRKARKPPKNKERKIREERLQLRDMRGKTLAFKNAFRLFLALY